MRISYLKYKNDKDSFKFAKNFGGEIIELENPEEIDYKIRELKNNNYTTIFVTNALASFSEDIIKKYQNDDKINIIIVPKKNNDEYTLK